MKRYLSLFEKYRRPALMGPVLVVIDVFAEIVQPALMSRIVDVGIAGRDVGYIVRVGLVMAGLALVALASNFGSVYFSSKASQGMGAELRKSLFAKIQTFSFANIDRFGSPSLITRLTNDVNTLQQTAMIVMRMLIRAPLMLVLALALSFAINAQLAMILLLALPILSAAIVLIIKKGLPLFSVMQDKLDKLNANVQENLTNVRVIKSFVTQKAEKKKFLASSAALRDTTVHAMSVTVMTMPITMLLMHMTTIIVLWFGGGLVAGGRLMTGQLISILSYITQILMSLTALSQSFMMFSRSRASNKRIFEVLDTPVDIEDGLEVGLSVTRGEVEFKNVSFSYHKGAEEEVIKDFSFKAEPGEVIAIVGSTGAGKTTLISLIARLYDADAGQVTVDGRDVRDYGLENLRRGIGMVMQRSMLFSGTIKENIAWGKEDATMEEIEAAAKAAQAHDFIMELPEGYDAVLGQGGMTLSGGQKQRLCIARAMIKKPKILILDDSTSAVDTATEMRIRGAFDAHLDATTFIIAQRISSVRSADRIIVLDDGRIRGVGSHERLMADNAIYREIYESQQDEVKQ
jgi:ATP-binding cassette subfamily B multidrug efflux pump